MNQTLGPTQSSQKEELMLQDDKRTNTLEIMLKQHSSPRRRISIDLIKKTQSGKIQLSPTRYQAPSYGNSNSQPALKVVTTEVLEQSPVVTAQRQSEIQDIMIRNAGCQTSEKQLTDSIGLEMS
jgi:hypothetical protein